MAAYKVTLLSAGVASFFNALFGMPIAWILARYRFPGRVLLDGLVDLPFALPTAVAGLTLATLFSTTGWYGNWLELFGIKVSYTWLGITVAMVFTSIPFVVRTVQPVLEELSPEFEEAAEILGAGHWQIFRSVILPELAPALLAGTALSFIRSLGEFGAVIFIAGNIAWKTEVISLIIFFVCRSLIILRPVLLLRLFWWYLCCCCLSSMCCNQVLVGDWEDYNDRYLCF
ncbi:MAG: hypothetical protein FKGGLIKP_00579 [Sodalis sp. Fse]|nr:MAG: hypothetical protein FKGGLIKP_00579 [Sodalis sp. Fse]